MSSTATLVAPTKGAAQPTPPAPPATIAETGLHPDTLAQLMLKTLVAGEMTGIALSESLRLPYSVLDALIQHARVEKLVEVRGTSGTGTAGYRYILTDLAQAGFNLDSPKRQSLLRVTLNSFGIEENSGALQVHATPENFPMRKHSLVQAMLAINDMFNLAEAQVASLFLEDVARWLDLHEVRYTPRVTFRGRSGYEHNYDFVIPRSKRQPERLLKAVNNPSKQAAEIVAFAWIDTKEVREPESKAFAVLNDSTRPIAGGVLGALSTYNIQPVLWSKRDEFREILAA